jgi:hypothetical protein
MALGLIQFLEIMLAALALVPSGCISRHVCDLIALGTGRGPANGSVVSGSLSLEDFIPKESPPA